MRRSGTVAGLNRPCGMVAILTVNGYTVIQVDPSCRIEVGDNMARESEFHVGPAVYENLSKASREGVFVGNHRVIESELALQLLE